MSEILLRGGQNNEKEQYANFPHRYEETTKSPNLSKRGMETNMVKSC